MSAPLAYLITFTCYGQWPHGDRRGSVDREHNVPGTAWLPPDSEYLTWSRSSQSQPSYQLDFERRNTVLAAISEVCRHRGWRLWAAHVRTLHIHVVASGHADPEKMMNDFKAYGSRALNQAGFEEPSRKRWTRHGSTDYINDPEHLHRAVEYVLFKQGTPQAVYDGRNEPPPAP